MTIFNYNLQFKKYSKLITYLTLVINNVCAMQNNNNAYITPPSSPIKHPTTQHADKTSPKRRGTKENISPNTSPDKSLVAGNVSYSPTGLTPAMNNMMIYSPVGLKTPKRYIDTTPTDKILELFVTNFLHYEEQSPLTPLIKFLFSLDDQAKLQRNACDLQRDPNQLFPKFLWTEIDEELFTSIFKMLQGIKFSDSKKMFQQGLNAAKKNFIERMEKILEEKYRFKNCSSNCVQNVDKKRCKACAHFTFTSTQKKWLGNLLEHLLIVTQEQNEEVFNRYKKLTHYLLAFYLYEWKPQAKSRSLKNLLDLCNNNNTLDANNKALFDVSLAAKELLEFNAFGCSYSHLLSPYRSQMQHSNTELIEHCIEKSPLYYLLCFNTQHQEMITRIQNICSGRYEPTHTAQNRVLLSELVQLIITDYHKSLDELTQSPGSSASLSKTKYAQDVLFKTFELIRDYLTQANHDDKHTQIILPECATLCSYDFKDLIRSALMIKNVIQIKDPFFDELMLVKDHHIEQVVYEFHEIKKKHEIGGGHLDTQLPYAINVNQEQHTIHDSYTLTNNTATGVSYRDWFIYNARQEYVTHKNAGVFPTCFNINFWSKYVLKLLKANPADRDICCYDSGKRIKEKDDAWKRMIIFKHEHAVGCTMSDCPSNQNSIMYVAAIIREEVIDSTVDYNDPANILRSLISLYPLSVYCLDYENGNLFLNGESIDDDIVLNKLIPHYFDYKRQSQADQGLIYDTDGKPLYEKTLLSCNAIHTSLFDASAKLKKQSARTASMAGNIDASSIEIVDPNTGNEFVLVKVAQSIIVKILKADLLNLS